MKTPNIKITIVAYEYNSTMEAVRLTRRFHNGDVVAHPLKRNGGVNEREEIFQSDVALVVGTGASDTEPIKQSLEEYGFAGPIIMATFNQNIPTKGVGDTPTKWDESHFNFGDGTTDEEFHAWLNARIERAVDLYRHNAAVCG